MMLAATHFKPSYWVGSEAERYGQFLRLVANAAKVWGLLGPSGWVTVTDPQGACSLPVWPDQHQARACAAGDWEGLTPVCIDIDEFLHCWLPDMEALGVRVDVFPLLGRGQLRVSAPRLQQHLIEQLAVSTPSAEDAQYPLLWVRTALL